MKKTTKALAFIFWMALFLLIAVYSRLNQTQWFYDNLTSLIIICLVFLAAKVLKMKLLELNLFGTGLLLHNCGTFGWYQLHYGILGYDSFVHLVNSAILAWIMFNLIIRKIKMTERKQSKRAFLNEHVLLFLLLTISVTSLIGTAIELVEFAGYSVLGSGEGLYFPGDGDADIIGNLPTGYADTMMDILTNILGEVIGTLMYYNFRYKHKRWLKY